MILAREVIPTREGTRDDCLVETVADLESIDCEVGSMAYCLADKKVYVKRSSGSWAAATAPLETEVAG
jgi:hypothetical protein